MNVDEVIEWMDALNCHFEYHDTPKKDRVRLAKGKLRGFSLSWWNCVQGERVKEGNNMMSSWDIMKARVKTHFLPS